MCTARKSIVAQFRVKQISPTKKDRNPCCLRRHCKLTRFISSRKAYGVWITAVWISKFKNILVRTVPKTPRRNFYLTRGIVIWRALISTGRLFHQEISSSNLLLHCSILVAKENSERPLLLSSSSRSAHGLVLVEI